MMPDFSGIARYMEDVICDEKHVPGCDILIARDHQLLFRHICGYADMEAGIPLGEQHVYYMYSCTKPVTVSAGMRLWEEGKLDLDAPVSDYLPAFANLRVMKNGVCVPCGKTLTVRHLFTMSGGFDYNTGTDAVKEAIRANNGHADTEQIVNAYAESPLCFEPGTRFQYSLCHDILAAVIEKAADMRFSEYLDYILFNPLGMTSCTFRETDEVRAALAAQYVSDGNGVVTRTDLRNSFMLTDRYESGGAGLICSAADYLRFADTMACEGMAENGYRYLKPETVALLRTEQLSSFTVDPAFSCAAGPGYGYGLGVRTRINRDDGQRSPVGEFGWDGAAGSYVMCDPVNHLSIFFAMHVCNWPACIGPSHAVMRDMIYDALGL
ncbi:MAG: serine hydrolase domain-containing protein [Eubacteriales bacterium]